MLYLQKLENECTALYGTDLHAIEESLPAIMHVIGNIHSVSRYCNVCDATQYNVFRMSLGNCWKSFESRLKIA